LTDSVDRLTDTMQELVKMLGPIAGAEREMQRAEHGAQEAEHFFGFRRHRKPAAEAESGAAPTSPSSPSSPSSPTSPTSPTDG
jgi:hypothetical protein